MISRFDRIFLFAVLLSVSVGGCVTSRKEILPFNSGSQLFGTSAKLTESKFVKDERKWKEKTGLSIIWKKNFDGGYYSLFEGGDGTYAFSFYKIKDYYYLAATPIENQGETIIVYNIIYFNNKNSKIYVWEIDGDLKRACYKNMIEPWRVRINDSGWMEINDRDGLVRFAVDCVDTIIAGQVPSELVYAIYD